MSQIAYQEHDKFKVFLAPFASERSLDVLASQVTAFAAQPNVAAKSIGAEYIESTQQLVLTLGYRTDEASYPVTVQSVSIDTFDPTHPANFQGLEQKIEEACDHLERIICQCPVITEDNEFIMVFLLHQA